MEKVFTEKTIKIAKIYWVNQWGACMIAEALWEEYTSLVWEDEYKFFWLWLTAKFGQVDCDEFDRDPDRLSFIELWL